MIKCQFKLRSLFIFISIILIAHPNLKAQFPNLHNYSYFQDTEHKEIDVVLSTIQTDDGFIISHVQQNKGFGVLKMDFNGRTIWTTNYVSPHFYHPSEFEIKLMDDGFVYGVSRGNFNPYDDNPKMASIWKIDESNGDISWVRDFVSDKPEFIEFADLDSQSIVVGHYDNQVAVLSTLNKSNGKLIRKQPFDTIQSPAYTYMSLSTDASHNIYVARGSRITCFNNGNKLWQRNYDPDIDIHEIYLDPLDSLFVISEYKKYHHVLSLDKATGAQLKDTKLNVYSSGRPKFILESDSFVYWVITGTASNVLERIVTIKLKRSDFSVAWISAENIAPKGSNASFQTATSAALDDRGNVLICGYHKYPINNSSVCSFMKISGATGYKIYSTSVSNYGKEFNHWSKAVHIGMRNRYVQLITHLDATDTYFQTHLITFDTTSWDRIDDYPIKSEYIAHSQTHDIIKNENQMIVFKQKGAKVQLEAYDLNQNLQWWQEYAQSYFTQGGRLLVKDGFAYFTCTNYLAHAFTTHNTDPSVPDPPSFLQLTKVDLNNGKMVFEDVFQTDQESLNTVQIQVIGASVYVIYEEGGFMKIRLYKDGKFTGSKDFGDIGSVESLRKTTQFNGLYNIAVPYNGDLLVAGPRGIYKVRDNPAGKELLYEFKSLRSNYHDIILKGDELIACGRSPDDGEGVIVGYNIAKDRVIIDGQFSSVDVFTSLTFLDDHLLLGGSSGGRAALFTYSYPKVSFNRIYSADDFAGNSLVQGFELFQDKEAIVWSGTHFNDDHTSDGVIGFVDLKGTSVHQKWFTDSLTGRSTIGIMERSNDSTIWFGGSHNRKEVNQGLIGLLTLDTTFKVKVVEDTSGSWVRETQLEAKIFPMPCSSELNVQLSNTNIHAFEMYDMMGKQVSVKVSHQTNNALRLEFNLNSGIYLLCIHTSVGDIYRKVEVALF